MKELERIQLVAGFVPVDMQTAANNGDWVNVAQYDHCLVVLFKGIGTNGDDPTLTLLQATDVTGAGSKALNFDRIFVKQGTQTGIGQFTEIDQVSANTYTQTDAAENEAIWAVEIDAEMLDSENGFTCIKGSVADVGGNAQLGCLFYIMSGARRAGKVANMPSAIV